MKRRKELLQLLFQRLEQQRVPYCVLRNFEDLLEDLETDIDLLVPKRDLTRFRECLVAAATATDYRLIQQNRFVNYSFVLWDGGMRLLRIDVGTEERWRIFEVLSGQDILVARSKLGEFYVTHPNHEYVILILQCVWRRGIRDRYRDRLALLRRRCENVPGLQTELRRAYGPLGEKLADIDFLLREGDHGLLERIRRAIIRRSLLIPRRALMSARHFVSDLVRVSARLPRPPGIVLKIFSRSDVRGQVRATVRSFDFLFPIQKVSLRMDAAGNAPRRMSLWMRIHNALATARCLFKGGIDLQFYRAATSAELTAQVAAHTSRGGRYPDRTFVCLVDEEGRGQLAHVGSGLMIRLSRSETQADEEFASRLVWFVCTMLSRPLMVSAEHRRGLFCVLVGLDGSGKTTLARNIAIASARNPQPRFRGVRYFHWMPRPWRPVEFPLPAYHEFPRTRRYESSPGNLIFTCIRLARNLAWAQFSYWLLVRRLVRQNYLVLLDRYFYNYLLDPASLKLAGPAWLRNATVPLFPKPDAVIVLRADPALLQSRKRELSGDEIAAQSARLDAMPVYAPRSVRLDASLPADEVAARAFAAILEMS